MDMTDDKELLIVAGISDRKSIHAQFINYEIAVVFVDKGKYSQVCTRAVNDEIVVDEYVHLETSEYNPDMFVIVFTCGIYLFAMSNNSGVGGGTTSNISIELVRKVQLSSDILIVKSTFTFQSVYVISNNGQLIEYQFPSII